MDFERNVTEQSNPSFPLTHRIRLRKWFQEAIDKVPKYGLNKKELSSAYFHISIEDKGIRKLRRNFTKQLVCQIPIKLIANLKNNNNYRNILPHQPPRVSNNGIFFIDKWAVQFVSKECFCTLSFSFTCIRVCNSNVFSFNSKF